MRDTVTQAVLPRPGGGVGPRGHSAPDDGGGAGGVGVHERACQRGRLSRR